MKLQIPKKETPSKPVMVRFKSHERERIEAEARKAAVPVATFVRLIVVQMVEAGIKVN